MEMKYVVWCSMQRGFGAALLPSFNLLGAATELLAAQRTDLPTVGEWAAVDEVAGRWRNVPEYDDDERLLLWVCDTAEQAALRLAWAVAERLPC